MTDVHQRVMPGIVALVRPVQVGVLAPDTGDHPLHDDKVVVVGTTGPADATGS